MADKNLKYYDTDLQQWVSPYAKDGDLVQLGQTVSNISSTVNDLNNTVTTHLDENKDFSKSKHFTVTSSKVIRPLVTFIDDDGHIDCYNFLKPLMDSKGFKACSAVVSGFIGSSGYMNENQITELQNNGWEIMSHSVSHPRLGDLTEEQYSSELINSKKTLEGLGLKINGFVYPYGSQNAGVRTLLKEHYDYAFAGWWQNLVPLNTTALKRITIGEDESLTLDNFKSRVDEAITNKYWLVLCLHVGSTSSSQRQILVDLLDYIESKSTEIDVVTARDAMKVFGNVFESRNEFTNEYIVVDATNKLHSSRPTVNSLPLPSQVDSGYIRYEKGANNLVVVSVNVLLKANFEANTVINLGTIPVGYRPLFSPPITSAVLETVGGDLAVGDVRLSLSDSVNLKLTISPLHTGASRKATAQLIYFAKDGE